MWELHVAMGGMPDILPLSRRRAYSDPRQRGTKLSIRKTSGSPPLLKIRETQCVPLPPGSPTSSGYGSFSTLGDGGQGHISFIPNHYRGSGPDSNLGTLDESPRSSYSSGMYAGIAVGSPLGCGPLNGNPLSNSGLSPVSETSILSSSPNSQDFTSSLIDIHPLRRPRLPSLSEVPSVAPIPENLPLMDTPRRPPLRQEDLEPLPVVLDGFIVFDKKDVTMSNAPGSKNPFQQSDATTGNEVPQTGTGGPVSGNQVQQLPDKSKQPDDGDPFSASQSSYRPRSGTWSMANSRRNKLKQEREEEVQSRQRRKSGDDVLNASAKEKEKEKKKDASPGFLDSFRPRSKSDAARGKKPNIISTVKNAVQHSLVSPNATTKSGRRSGDATPVETAAVDQDVYHTWHAGAGPKTTIGRVWDLFRSHRNETTEERQRRKSGGKHEKGQLVRRHSMEPERKRNGGSTFGHTYLRGEDPNQAAIIFRDCRGLPATAPFLENVKRSELEEDESQILVKFFKYHTSYDLIPTSAKLVIFDTRLQVKKAFYALVYNGVRAAPLWDAVRQEFVGMLTITDFIRILQSFYNSPNRKMEELEEHRLEMWRTLLNDDVRKLISITPNECLYEAIRSLIHHKIHRLPVIDPTTGNVLYIITHKRILKFLFLYINELPKPSIMLKSLRELKIGTYENIETARGDTLIIEALNKFVERRISALPIVDDEGKLIDIYAKFDVINLAAEGTYHNLDVTLHQANEYRNEWFEGVLKCTLDETMEMVMERIVRAEVHRLVVVDNNNKVIGIISLSDILNELVLKPCDDDPASIFRKTVAQMESALNGDQEDEEVTPRAEDTSNLDRLKTESEESVSKSWEGSDTDNVEKKEEGPSSSAESIDDANKFAIDVSKISETMGQHEIGPISG